VRDELRKGGESVFEDKSIYLCFSGVNKTDAGREGVLVLLMDFYLPNRWLRLLLWIVRKGSYENFRDYGSRR